MTTPTPADRAGRSRARVAAAGVWGAIVLAVLGAAAPAAAQWRDGPRRSAQERPVRPGGWRDALRGGGRGEFRGGPFQGGPLRAGDGRGGYPGGYGGPPRDAAPRYAPPREEVYPGSRYGRSSYDGLGFAQPPRVVVPNGGGGYGGRAWRRGEVLPGGYRGAPVPDPGRYHLRRAPNGYDWVGDDRNAYLVQRSTGMVLDSVPGAYDPPPPYRERRR